MTQSPVEHKSKGFLLFILTWIVWWIQGIFFLLLYFVTFLLYWMMLFIFFQTWKSRFPLCWASSMRAPEGVSGSASVHRALWGQSASQQGFWPSVLGWENKNGRELPGQKLPLFDCFVVLRVEDKTNGYCILYIVYMFHVEMFIVMGKRINS